MAEKLSKVVPLYVYKFPVPKTQKVQFETTFKGVDEVTLDNFRKISNMRDEMKAAVDMEATTAATSAIERYLPVLFGFMQTVETLPPDFARGLRVIWSTSFGSKYAWNPLVNDSFYWEVIMALNTCAILYRQQAHIDIQTCNPESSDFEEKSKLISSNLCKASGIFEYISQQLLTKWTSKPPTMINEAVSESYVALSNMCLAEAQQIAIQKGLVKGMQTGTLCKLAADVAMKFEYSMNVLKSIPDTMASILTYLNVSSVLWKAVSFKLAADDLYHKGSYGNAVAHINASLFTIDCKMDLSGLDQSFLSVYNEEKMRITGIRNQYVTENDTIYYENPPTGPISLPESKNLTKVTPYQPPNATPIHIVLKKGSECCIQ